MLQSMSQSIIDEYLGKLPMGIFFTKVCYIIVLMLSLKRLRSDVG